MQDPVLLCGLGRSGSNVLLDSLDLSRQTHCRNEPDAYKSSPLVTDVLAGDENSLEQRLEAHWDEALHWMCSMWSDRDRINPHVAGKSYIRPSWWKLGIPQRLLHQARVRAATATVIPSLRGPEFRLPGWMFVPNWMDKATHVLKIASLYPALPWIKTHRPGTRIVYLARYPLGYAQSLYKRLYSSGDTDMYHRQNQDWIRSLLANAEQIGIELPTVDPDSLDLFETVIWSWLLLNETQYRIHKDSESVYFLTYERMLASPVVELEKVYGHCGLTWTDEVVKSLQFMFSKSAKLALSFQKYWDDEHKQRASAILAQSSVVSLWNDELWCRLEELAIEQGSSELTYDPFK